jgi:hypothetical protein
MVSADTSSNRFSSWGFPSVGVMLHKVIDEASVKNIDDDAFIFRNADSEAPEYTG